MFLFLATDVFLFYVFFEVILIPMYFLIGGFGGARRAYAASKFLIFGLLGGFVMLASVIGLYVLSARAGQASYLLSDLSGLDHRHRDRTVAVRRLHVRVRDQGSAGSAAHLAAGRRRGVQSRRRDHDGRGDGQDRHLRDDPVLPGAVPGGQPVGHPGDHRARGHLDHLRSHPGHRQPGSDAADRLHLDQPLRLHRPRHLRLHLPEPGRIDALHAQPRALDCRVVPGGRLPDQAARLPRRGGLRRRADGGPGARRVCCSSPDCRRSRCRVCPASFRSSWCWPGRSADIRLSRSCPLWPSSWPRSTSC